MALETRQSKQEAIPAGLQLVELPDSFSEIQRRITRRLSREEPGLLQGREMGEVSVVDGFEDVLREPFGAGFFYNTPTSVYQLAFVLSVCPNPEIAKFLADETASASEIIKKLRNSRVLTGVKILDLGSGSAEFAIVAQALGAKTYTADVENLSPETKTKLERHITVNLNQPNAIEVLQDGTGGSFDIVTENIIGTTPMSGRNLRQPESKRIIEIADVLLKSGGYLYDGENIHLRNKALRKR